MKNTSTLSILIIILFPFQLLAQQPYSKVLSLDNNQYESVAVEKAFDEGCIVLANAFWKSSLVKLDNEGDIIWNKSYILNLSDTLYNTYAKSLITTNDSCYLFAGDFVQYSGDEKRGVFLIKTDIYGDTIWSSTINDTQGLYVLSDIEQCYDNGFILTGLIYEYYDSPTKILSAKISSDGVIEWIKYLDSSLPFQKGTAIKELPDSSIIIATVIDSSLSYNDQSSFSLINLSSSGEQIWSIKYIFQAPSYQSSNSINEFFIWDNSILLCATIASQIHFINIDFSGNINWQKYLGSSYYYSWDMQYPKFKLTNDSTIIFTTEVESSGSFYEVDSLGFVLTSKDLFLRANDIVETSNGYLIIGNGPLYFLKEHEKDGLEVGLIQIDNNGNGIDCIWEYSTFSTYVNQISFDSINFIETTGGSNIDIHLSIDSLNILTSNGCVEGTGSIEEYEGVGNLIISPNPSTGIVDIDFINHSIGTLYVYNSGGALVLSKQVNTNSSFIDLSNQPQGIFFIRFINSKNEVSTGKVVISQ